MNIAGYENWYKINHLGLIFNAAAKRLIVEVGETFSSVRRTDKKARLVCLKSKNEKWGRYELRLSHMLDMLTKSKGDNHFSYILNTF